MAPKEIIFSPNAEKEIKKLSKQDQSLVLDALKKWRDGKTKPNIEKIKSQPDFFRLKAGHFRLVYYPLSPERVVLLLIRNRKDAYQGLSSLPTKLDTALRKLRMVKR